MSKNTLLGEYVWSFEVVDNKRENRLIGRLKERYTWQGYGSECDKGSRIVSVFNQPV